MDYKYEFNDIFLKDIDKVIFYLRFNLLNEKAADKLTMEIIKSVENIILFPNSYPDCRKLYIEDQSIRHKRIKNYIIFYKVTEDKVSFLRFRYSKQNIFI